MQRTYSTCGGTMEPTTTGGLFTAKFVTLIAGFAGAIVSLSFVAPLNLWQRVTAVFAGAASSYYLTPLLLITFNWPASDEVTGGVGFVVGITAMNIIPGFIRASEAFKANPLRFLNVRGASDSDKGGQS